MDEKAVMDALVQMKRTGNLLNELWDLTQQLGESIDRNDQVSIQMLIAMREEPLGKLQAADQALREQLEACKGAGVTGVYVGNLGLVPLCKEMGFTLRGDFGLQVFNSQGVKEYKRLGFQSLTASFELKLAQIRDLSKAVDLEIIAYGRLPLMITENCAIKNQSGKCVCSNVNLLTDRKGVRFPVERAYGCRNEILNANKVFLADKAADWKRAGLRAIRLLFTTENGVECAQVLEAYRGKGNYIPNNYTRGLYYRDVP